MSVQAIAAVFDYSRARAGARLVMLSLANHADKDGLCFPSVRHIAQETLMSERQVHRVVSQLVESGEVVTLRCVRANGAYTSSLYIVNVGPLADRFAWEGQALVDQFMERHQWGVLMEGASVNLSDGASVNLSVGQVTPTSLGQVSQMSPANKGSVEPSIEPSEGTTPKSPNGEWAGADGFSQVGGLKMGSKEKQKAAGRRVKQGDSLKTLREKELRVWFDAWFAEYPNKVAPGAAWKAFLTVAPDRALMTRIAGATRLWAASWDWTKDGGRFVPRADKWLSDERWNDPAPLPEPVDADDGGFTYSHS